MRRIKASLLWVLDVMVAVFIGPVERSDERGQVIRRLAARRTVYVFMVAGFMLIIVTAYAILMRWPGGPV